MLTWLAAEKIKSGRMTAIGGASGLVAGLVAITPACGFVTFGGGLIIGLLSGIVCYMGIQLKHKLGYDDALDVVGVHGLGGLFGAIATGVFADASINSAVTGLALKDGRGALIMHQLIAVGAVGTFAFVVTFILAKIIQATVGLRGHRRSRGAGPRRGRARRVWLRNSHRGLKSPLRPGEDSPQAVRL